MKKVMILAAKKVEASEDTNWGNITTDEVMVERKGNVVLLTSTDQNNLRSLSIHLDEWVAMVNEIG